MSSQFKDYYNILGIPKDADSEAIKKAYREGAKSSHPDMNQNDPTAEARFKDLNEAYEVLGDPKNRGTRVAYDRIQAKRNTQSEGSSFRPQYSPQTNSVPRSEWDDFYDSIFRDSESFIKESQKSDQDILNRIQRETDADMARINKDVDEAMRRINPDGNVSGPRVPQQQEEDYTKIVFEKDPATKKTPGTVTPEGIDTSTYIKFENSGESKV